MANCPNFHGLTKFNTSAKRYTCDICRTRISSYSEAYGCRSCDYDLCKKCYNEKNSKSKSGDSGKLQSLFAKQYADKEDPDIMSEAGMMKFFKDCGVNPESYETLVIAFHIKSTEMGIYDKNEFCKGFAESGCKDVKDIKKVIQDRVRAVQNNLPEYKRFYKWVFHHVKEDEKKKSIPTELAIQLWSLVLAKQKASMKLLDDWIAFCDANKSKDMQAISKDVWEQIFDFLLQTNSIDSYDDAGGAWPVAVDEFVEWMQEKKK
mmetsp:Transcript_40560/g.66642  ORF Transcript_40560/g.66642 Transcript_40560/m.66642 type:complete len:262 (+) Transcript_40560:66-851(+)|eukprot:CAMPEP_0202685308 /NCGR_PEP_ID=MMETSP1385-20130828/1059_1 /ASSEMBLY_ACC=CAM_ASM_000861 /TAXON_ID=933848 /ORGANISM="Elphidium margaritaceum" /LENGTH=261 /DNA_ID=CAMNT_0049339623 /DNA_START=44 /DNA_END=829 /DNA_ORIENTATION=+